MRSAERTVVRPTVFGLVVAVVLIAAIVLSPPTADPSVTGLVWAGLAGAVALGVIWPVVTVRTVRLRALAAPTDLVVGQLATLELDLDGRAAGLAIAATGSGAVVVDIVSPGSIRVPFTVARRGAYRQLRVDVSSDAPFGIMHATRTRLVELPHQLLVGPIAEPHPVEPGPLPSELAEPVPAGSGSTGDSVRSVRAYVTGDPAHLVHWPSTARTGSLVVRELEPPAANAIAIVVDLTSRDAPSGDDQSAAERASAVERTASLAAGAARAAHERAARVLLCTAEASGPVAAEAPDELSVQRRLALAVPGRPAAAPDRWPVLVLAAAGVPAGTGGPGGTGAPAGTAVPAGTGSAVPDQSGSGL